MDQNFEILAKKFLFGKWFFYFDQKICSRKIQETIKFSKKFDTDW